MRIPLNFDCGQCSLDVIGENMAKKKIILTVHGIGEQKPYETLRMVTNQFTRIESGAKYKSTVSLGYFHTNEKHLGNSLNLDDNLNIHTLPHLKGSVNGPANSLGFSECYWGDIPNDYVDTYLDSADNWIKALVGRVKRFSTVKNFRIRAANANNKKIINNLNSKNIAEYSETLDMLRRLIRHTFRMIPLFKVNFNFKRIVNNFLGDVQFYAEYQTMREKILKRFHDRMEGIHEEMKGEDYEVHIIAHSLGTVISFHGLLRAISSGNNTWLNHVDSFTTIGSPIDKFLFLFPNIMKKDEETANTLKARENRIRWYNYSDVNDPVAAPLNDARDPAMMPWVQNSFDFPEPQDVNMKRYLMPGLAHVDYWKDDELFDLIAHQTCWPSYKGPNGVLGFDKDKLMNKKCYPFYLRWLSHIGGLGAFIFFYIPVILMVVGYFVISEFVCDFSAAIASFKLVSFLLLWAYLSYVHFSCMWRVFEKFEKSKHFLSKA